MTHKTKILAAVEAIVVLWRWWVYGDLVDGRCGESDDECDCDFELWLYVDSCGNEVVVIDNDDNIAKMVIMTSDYKNDSNDTKW